MGKRGRRFESCPAHHGRVAQRQSAKNTDITNISVQHNLRWVGEASVILLHRGSRGFESHYPSGYSSEEERLNTDLHNIFIYNFLEKASADVLWCPEYGNKTAHPITSYGPNGNGYLVKIYLKNIQSGSSPHASPEQVGNFRSNHMSVYNFITSRRVSVILSNKYEKTTRSS